jgi:uncharacterized delta-60 repeat protein
MTARRFAGLAVVLLLALPAAADLGEVDPTWPQMNEIFGCGFSRCEIRVQAMLPRPHGKLLLLVKNTYSVDIGSHYHTVFVVRQRNADGSLDRTFQGMAVSLPRDVHFGPIGGGAIDVQADGKVLAAGLQGMNCTPQGYDCEAWLSVVRSLPDGSPDPSFGTNGRFLLKAHGAPPVSALRVLADGRMIVVAGAPYRLTASGTLDPTYGTAGKGVAVNGQKVLVLSDGRVLVLATTASGFTLTRLDPEGAPDTTFNGTGSREYPVSGATVAVDSLVLQDDRMLVAANETVAGGSSLVIRILPDGTPDAGFGTGGTLRSQTGGHLSLLSLDAQRRIVGVVRPSGTTSIQWVRWQPDGSALELVGPASSDEFGASLPHIVVLLGSSKGMLARAAATTRYGRNALEDDREFARQQYRDFLAREGDPLGVQYWRDRTLATSRDVVIEEFLRSPEFEGRIAPVMRLYLAYFLRVPDYAGLQFWVDFSRTESLEGISDAFAASPEFAARYGSATDEEFVALVYQNVLGRAPDTAGRDFWVGQLASGARTRGQVMVAFSESAEFIESSRSEVLVAMLYAGMLRREPDAAGFEFWTGYIDSGESPNLLIRNFRESSEYEERFAP